MAQVVLRWLTQRGVLVIPLAFLGGFLNLPADLFRVVVGRILLRPAPNTALGPPSRLVALAVGGGLGLLSGLRGTDGGIFLTPLFMHQRWAPARQTAAVAAVFILVNSLAGLLGSLGGAHVAGARLLPSYAPWLALAAISGGAAGSYFGSRWFAYNVITLLLAAVLFIAGAKLILT
ncbi:TSUP family transporter [Hymenobacter convexus]|uniref:TSUP family transporter n=1 Tax=Hymenobacter sp. CA1UV-4 TaxID=3063782 RepID=UPI0027124362|nr:TSUP family transporter [Hymenobacter sp. CA1UV-4]MDO7854636.1 TSUP family transporter [Hymenobacter sp. CA1UV-4]